MKSKSRQAAAHLRAAIKAAHKDLRAKGYFCRTNFWCCSTCALAAIPEGRGDKFVFYHRQDNRDIDKSGSCMLAWAGDGDEIASAMERAGLKVEWDGSERTRILVAIE